MTKRTLYVTKILSDYLVTVSPCASRKFSGRLREETEEPVRMQIVLCTWPQAPRSWLA